MKTALISISLILATLSNALAQDAVPQQTPLPKIECYCTDSTGDRREMGEMICLYVGGRSFTARCEMSLNSPMWREVNDGCNSASLNNQGRFLDEGNDRT